MFSLFPRRGLSTDPPREVREVLHPSLPNTVVVSKSNKSEIQWTCIKFVLEGADCIPRPKSIMQPQFQEICGQLVATEIKLSNSSRSNTVFFCEVVGNGIMITVKVIQQSYIRN